MMTSRAFLITPIALLLMAQAPDAQRISAASPIETLHPLAVAGDAAAMFYLGVKYSDGNGVPKDEAEALRWFRAVADRRTVMSAPRMPSFTRAITR